LQAIDEIVNTFSVMPLSQVMRARLLTDIAGLVYSSVKLLMQMCNL